MIATNECIARFLATSGGASLRRVVRFSERWLRIAEVAKQLGELLQKEQDSLALAEFLARRHKADPLRLPDLSLVIVKRWDEVSTSWSTLAPRRPATSAWRCVRLHALHRSEPPIPRPDTSRML